MIKSKDERYYDAYLSHHKISRRGLLRGMFRPVERTVKVESTQIRLAHRPPFAAKEELFLAACTGCGVCMSACPHNLIQIQQQKAVLEIEYMSCDLCGKCAESCPTQALHLTFKRDTELRPIFSNECLITQNQICTSCQERCPTQAINTDLTINNELCNGCGECKMGCFLSAISLN